MLSGPPSQYLSKYHHEVGTILFIAKSRWVTDEETIAELDYKRHKVLGQYTLSNQREKRNGNVTPGEVQAIKYVFSEYSLCSLSMPCIVFTSIKLITQQLPWVLFSNHFREDANYCQLWELERSEQLFAKNWTAHSSFGISLLSSCQVAMMPI